MWGEAENTWIVHFGEDEAKRRSHYSLQLPEQRAKLFSVVTNDRMWENKAAPEGIQAEH